MSKNVNVYPSKKVIQTYEMLKSGKSVKVSAMVAQLGCQPGSLMVNIFQLRDRGGDIKTEREGRKAVSYRLLNAAEIAPLMVAKPRKGKAAKVAAPVKVAKVKSVVSRKPAVKADEFDVPILDADMQISDVSEEELADLKMQLGLA